MKNQLEILLEIQKLDDGIKEAEARQRAIPQIVLNGGEALERDRQELELRKKSLQEATLRQRRLEKDLKEVAEQLGKKQARKFAVKTNEEYKALLKEIEYSEQENSKIEDGILALFDEIENIEASVKQQNAHLHHREKEVLAEKETLEQEIAQNALTQEEMHRQRALLCEELREEYLDAYEKIRSQRQGSAVVVVKGDVCPGCNMFIPPQTVNEVLQTGEIRNCPHCRRIIYCALEAKSA